MALAAAVSLSASGGVGCGATKRNGSPASGGAGGGTAGTSGTGFGGEGARPSEPEYQAVPTSMRRLNAAEYRNTVSDLLSVEVGDVALPHDAELNGFDTAGGIASMTESDYLAALMAAEEVAKQVVESPELLARVAPCASPGPECASRLVTETGLRLFRRPLLEEEQAIYERVYEEAEADGEDHRGAVGQVIMAMLASAQFWYRIELEDGHPGPRDLNGFELASRLSFLLWSSAPDDRLLERAASDLTGEEAFEEELERLWEDEKALRFTTNFAGQWLRLRHLPEHEVASEVYPEWNAAVAEAAQREGFEYFQRFVTGGQSWNDFVTGQPHPIPVLLAPLYGVQASPAGEPRLTSTLRSGFLGSVAFASLTSLDRRSDPTLRSMFVLRRLLCSPPPEPPPSIPAPGTPATEFATPRAAIESYSREAVCASCHQLFDGIGFALERLDGIGRYRTQYENGAPVDSAVRLPASDAYPDGMPAEDVDDVARWVVTDARYVSCAAKQLYNYGTGRIPDEADQSNMAKLSAAWSRSSDLTIQSLVNTFARSNVFRAHGGGEQP